MYVLWKCALCVLGDHHKIDLINIGCIKLPYLVDSVRYKLNATYPLSIYNMYVVNARYSFYVKVKVVCITIL